MQPHAADPNDPKAQLIVALGGYAHELDELDEAGWELVARLETRDTGPAVTIELHEPRFKSASRYTADVLPEGLLRQGVIKLVERLVERLTEKGIKVSYLVPIPSDASAFLLLYAAWRQAYVGHVPLFPFHVAEAQAS